MNHLTSYETRFAASHTLPFPPCDKPHGHTWHVRVTVGGEPDPDDGGAVCKPEELRRTVDTLIREIDMRDLDAMITPAIPSPNGVAAWIWERIALMYRLEEVRVWHERGGGMLRR